jgi:hypothetical protein
MMQKRFPAVLLAAALLTLGMSGAANAANYTLSLEATTDGNTVATQYTQGSDLYLNIAVDNMAGVAGCAFTLEYSPTLLTAPATGTDGTPTVPGEIITTFPFTFTHGQYTNYPTNRENSATEAGKILFSGAAINTTTGGAPYTNSGAAELFTVKFKVKSDAPINSLFGFKLTQTYLWNPLAGYGLDSTGTPVTTDRAMGAGDQKEPVPVLVGAVDKNDPNWYNLNAAFPVHTVTLPVTLSGLQVVSEPTYNVAGTVSYTGPQVGTLHVAAYRATDLVTPAREIQYSWTQGATSKAYLFDSSNSTGLPAGTFKIYAWIDTASNGKDTWEAQGLHSSDVVVSNAALTGKDITLGDPDTDADGLPDWWEALYCGGNCDPNADTDSDGYKNSVEYQNGTDPTVQTPTGLPGYNPATDNRIVGAYQIVSVNPADSAAAVGSTVTVTVRYTTSDANNASTGIGFYVHFDSTKLEYMGYSDYLEVGGVKVRPTLRDTEQQDDGDPSTDKEVVMSWVDSSVAWPGGTLPVDLVKIGFRIKNAFNGNTALNITSNVTGAGYAFTGQGGTVHVQNWNMDVDGDGDADSMTDGVMAVRYMLYNQLGIMGPGWSANLFGLSGTRNTENLVKPFLDNGAAAFITDVDGDGDNDAMTDGVLIVRYQLYTQLGIMGPGWSANLFDTTGTRKTEDAVKTYLDALMP